MKKLIIFVPLLCVFVFLVVVIGSIDSNNFDDSGLLAQIEAVPNSENGYSEIEFTQANGFRFNGSDDISTRVREIVERKRWDDEAVLAIVELTDEYVEHAVLSLEYPEFQLPKSESVFDQPSYVSLMTLGNLLIVRSMYEAKHGNLDEAIRYAGSALEYSQRLKAGSSGLLLLHMMGLASQYRALDWLGALTARYSLTSAQYKNALSVFDVVLPYQGDTFSLVFVGEFGYLLENLRAITEGHDKSFGERWQSRQQHRSLESSTLKEGVIDFMLVLFPKYYFHKNKALTLAAKQYAEIAGQSSEFCNAQNFLGSDMTVEAGWLDILMPNSQSKYLNFQPVVFRDYFIRRCFAHVHSEAVKGTIAIQHYRHDKGHLPESLQVLVPQYLSALPIDAFNGGPLLYSKEKARIYSVGMDFLDGGGADSTSYVYLCAKDDACATNPTFRIQ